MTGEQRLAVALELHELSCNVAREGIRRQNPKADETEVERLLRHRIGLANFQRQKAELAIARKLA
jgi:type II secretory pathway predicted ATPase ExeA